MVASDTNPTPTQSDLLNTLVRFNFSIPDLVRAHNLSARAARRLLTRPRDPAQLTELRRFVRIAAHIATLSAQPAAIATLSTIIANPESEPTESRRAASAILRAIPTTKRAAARHMRPTKKSTKKTTTIPPTSSTNRMKKRSTTKSSTPRKTMNSTKKKSPTAPSTKTEPGTTTTADPAAAHPHFRAKPSRICHPSHSGTLNRPHPAFPFPSHPPTPLPSPAAPRDSTIPDPRALGTPPLRGGRLCL